MNILAILLLTTLQNLAGVAFRADAAGLEQARMQFEEAGQLYNAALADYLLSMASGGDSARSAEAARRAEANLQKSIELDPSRAHAFVLRNRNGYMLMQTGVLKPPDAFKMMLESYNAAKKLAPDDALTILLDGAHRYYAPNGSREEGRALMRRSIELLTAQAPDDPHAAIWLPIVWAWYGQMFLSEGEMEKAREAFEATLRVRPDYAFVRTGMLPMTELVSIGAAPKIAGDQWHALLSDAEGDGQSAAMPDLRAVAWSRRADRVWFRFDLAAAPDPARFGINLALDLDGDPNNGNGWWAGNTAFKYDRLVTVWVGRGTDGRYRGTVGTAEASDAAAGRFASSAPGAVAFALGERALFVGVPRKAIGDRARVVATVGSNTGWNDVAPAEGAAVLELTRRAP